MTKTSQQRREDHTQAPEDDFSADNRHFICTRGTLALPWAQLRHDLRLNLWHDLGTTLVFHWHSAQSFSISTTPAAQWAPTRAPSTEHLLTLGAADLPPPGLYHRQRWDWRWWGSTSTDIDWLDDYGSTTDFWLTTLRDDFTYRRGTPPSPPPRAYST